MLIFQTFEFFFRLKTWKNLRALSSCTSQTTASKFWRIWRRTAAWPPSIWPPTGSASSTISSPCKMLKSSGSTTTWYLLVVAYWLIWLIMCIQNIGKKLGAFFTSECNALIFIFLLRWPIGPRLTSWCTWRTWKQSTSRGTPFKRRARRTTAENSNLLSPASPRSMPLFADRRTKENYKQPFATWCKEAKK